MLSLAAYGVAKLFNRVRTTRTERGWGGHHILVHRCVFRRNTLIERGDQRIIVSTVGGYCIDVNGKPMTMDTVGDRRHYETCVFGAKWEDGVWDTEIWKRYGFRALWVEDVTAGAVNSKLANDMHEAVVSEMMKAEEWEEQ